MSDKIEPFVLSGLFLSGSIAALLNLLLLSVFTFDGVAIFTIGYQGLSLLQGLMLVAFSWIITTLGLVLLLFSDRLLRRIEGALFRKVAFVFLGTVLAGIMFSWAPNGSIFAIFGAITALVFTILTPSWFVDL